MMMAWPRNIVIVSLLGLLQEQLFTCSAIRVYPGSTGKVVEDRRWLADAAIDGESVVTSSRNTKKTTTVNVEIPASPDGHLVTSLPLLDPTAFTTKHWAGHLPVTSGKDNYFFYWLFAPDQTGSTETKDDKDIPLVIWLNGGPACSSMDGLFIENGPFRFTVDQATKEYRLTPDEYSWHKLPAYVLYIDQPVGTGLSFTTNEKYPSNDEQLSTDFYYFLQQFLQLHSDKFVVAADSAKNANGKVMNRPLYFSGESYAGHYNVIFANHILKKNQALSDGDIRILIKGAAIGNGWLDPFYQYAGARAAYGHGLIGTAELAALNEKEKQCQAQLAAGNYEVGLCFDLIDDIVANSHGANAKVHVSSYDIRRTEVAGGGRAFPPGHQIIETYLGKWPLSNHPGKLSIDLTDQVLKELHAEAATQANQRYKECTDPPYYALSKSDGKGAVSDVIAVLEHSDNVELLFFNGIMDLVCNHVGNEQSLEKLAWSHNEDWNMSPRYAWSAPTEPVGKVSGYMREFNNLKFLKIMNAGHMVPLDVPSAAFYMMKNFVYQQSFKNSMQDLKRSKVTECPACPDCPDFFAAKSEGMDWIPIIGWSVAGAVLVAGLCTIAIVRSRRRRRLAIVMGRTRVPDYDVDVVELRESRYMDKAVSDDDEDDDDEAPGRLS